MPAAVAIPLITAGVGAGATMYSAHKQAKATQQAADRLGANAAMLQKTGQDFIGRGTDAMAGRNLNPDIARAASYYRTLASGDKAAGAAALMPESAAITDAFRGARSRVGQTTRGGTRQLAEATLARDEAAQRGGLRAQLRPGAVASMAELGKFQTQTGLQQQQLGVGALTGTTAPLSSLYAGNIGLSRDTNAYANQAGGSFGKILIDLAKSGVFGGGNKPPVATTTWTPPMSPYMAPVGMNRP